MTDSKSNIIRFDAYLYNELSKDDRAIFEKELEINSELAEEFSNHKKFLDDFFEGVEYRETTKNLKSIHKSIYNPDSNFFTNRKFYIPLLVAASVLIMFMVINPKMNEGSESAPTGHDDELAYAESPDSSLMEEDSYSANVTMMTDTVIFEPAPEPKAELLSILNSSPAGTAFMISRDGYFLTSEYVLNGLKIITLQQKQEKLTFEAKVVFTDADRNFAILKCAEKIALNFKGIPFRFIGENDQTGEEVFTLGYPKSEIEYRESVISSKNGYASDSMSFKISMPSQKGYSGAPLFAYNGDLIGMINTNNSDQKSVTYVLDHHYIQNILDSLRENDIEFVNMSQNYNIRPKNHDDLVKWYKPFIFEVHP